jgi:multimeric flavodoxin WrbA
MNVVSILASPNGEKGNTGRLLAAVVNAAEKRGAQCETIVLRGDSLKACKGCNLCHKKGTCFQQDDFQTIKEKMLMADGLILATPNYISQVSGQMKVFLDRCSVLLHCMSLHGKYGLSVVTSGGGDEWPIVQYLNHFLMTVGVTPVDAVWASMGPTDNTPLDEDTRRYATVAGENLVEAWQQKKRFACVEKLQDIHRTNMRGLVHFYQTQWPFEFEYWQKLDQRVAINKKEVSTWKVE